ncbi:MAG: hypothetical protein L6R41_001803 [Letrouitia leprolyta]|nr:MAG: hypothetical protein L6R41_001803 [Letrouitia leprolyta]
MSATTIPPSWIDKRSRVIKNRHFEFRFILSIYSEHFKYNRCEWNRYRDIVTQLQNLQASLQGRAKKMDTGHPMQVVWIEEMECLSRKIDPLLEDLLEIKDTMQSTWKFAEEMDDYS